MTRTLQLSLLTLVLIFGISTSVYAQSADLGIRVDAGAALNASSSAGDADSEEPSSTDAEATADADTTAGASFSLNRLDAAVTNSTGAAIDAASVNTKSDLEAYAAATLRSGSSFENVEVTADGVVLSFKENARLLGIIPHTITSRIEVDGDGSVRVVRPWYRFLVAGLSSDTSANLEARIGQALQQHRAEGSAGLSARAQAVILSEVIAATQSSVAQSADATASVGASSDTTIMGSN